MGLDDVMVVVSDAPRGSLDDQAKRFALQWERARIKTEVYDSGTRTLRTTYESPKRHVRFVSSSASEEEVKRAMEDAARDAGKGGLVMVNYGHGSGAGAAPGRRKDSFVDLTPSGDRRIVARDITDQSGAGFRVTPTPKEAERVSLLKAVGAAMRRHQVGVLQFLVCDVGKDEQFAQDVANTAGTTVGFFRSKFGHAEDSSGRVTGGNYYRNRSGKLKLVANTESWTEVKAPDVVVKPDEVENAVED